MRTRLITTLGLVFAAAAAAAPAALGEPKNPTPVSPGMCNMLHANEKGIDGMMNGTHVFDIMIPNVEASFAGGCTP